MTKTNDPRSAGEQRIGREVHSAAIPPAEPFIDTGARSLRAEQEAGRMVASNTLDPDTVLAGEGRMPGEILIDTRASLDAAENHKARVAAAQEGLVHVVAAYDGDLTPADKVSGSLAHVQNRMAETKATLEQAKSASAAAIKDLDGASPARVVRAKAEAAHRHWWVRHVILPTVLAGAIELIATANAVYVFMRLDDWGSAFVVSASAIMALTVAPMVAGLLAASWRKLGGFSWLHFVGTVGLLLLWATTGGSLAVIRVLSTQDLRTAAQATSPSLAEQAGKLGVDLSASTSGAASNPGIVMAFWIVVLLALGAVLFVKEAFWHVHESAQRVELGARMALWQAENAHAAWVARQAAILNQVALQKADIQSVDVIYCAEFDKIRLRAEYERARYRNELILVVGDPEMTSAFEVRFDLGSTVADITPFTPAKIELPGWATGPESPAAKGTGVNSADAGTDEKEAA